MNKTYCEEGCEINWIVLKEKLCARFRLIEYDDFNEALPCIKQTDLLHDYERNFECLRNQICGWTQKSLIGAFINRLKPKLANGIRMFRSKALKDTISLTGM